MSKVIRGGCYLAGASCVLRTAKSVPASHDRLGFRLALADDQTVFEWEILEFREPLPLSRTTPLLRGRKLRTSWTPRAPGF